jgi:hypothetical protein
MTRALLLLTAVFAMSHAEARAGQAGPQTRIDPLTASISGRVTTAETGAPLRRAEVRATSERGVSRLTTTDGEGRYVVRDLPAGSYTLHVSKTGFVPLYFGQYRPFERRTIIGLNEGERFSASVALRRAGAITGRIVDRAGEPVTGARVQVLRRTVVQGARGLQAAGVSDITDDTGAYRVYALPPGDYYVIVTPRRVEDSAGRLVRQEVPGRGSPIFYPGTANREEAQRITVDASGEARADMTLVEVRTSRVSGVVLTAMGAPAGGAMVTLMSQGWNLASSMASEPAALQSLQFRDDAAPDGTFAVEGVPPGAYTLVVQTRPAIPIFGSQTELRNSRPLFEAGSVSVTVAGDVDGLTVTTSPGGTVDVEFVAADGVTAPLPSRIRLTARMTDRSSESATMGAVANARVRLELLRPARLDVEGLPENWAVKAILLDNLDVTDAAIQVKGGSASVRVVLTDRVTEVTGSVAAPSSDSAPTTPATVVAFADDEKKWTYPSRFIRIARTNERGAFRMLGLPPDETYRFVAVDYLEDGEETDPDFLGKLRERATRLRLVEGDRKAIDLRAIQR